MTLLFSNDSLPHHHGRSSLLSPLLLGLAMWLTLAWKMCVGASSAPFWAQALRGLCISAFATFSAVTVKGQGSRKPLRMRHIWADLNSACGLAKPADLHTPVRSNAYIISQMPVTSLKFCYCAAKIGAWGHMVTMSIIIAYHMGGCRRRWDVWSPHPGAAAAGWCLHRTPQPDPPAVVNGIVFWVWWEMGLSPLCPLFKFPHSPQAVRASLATSRQLSYRHQFC